MENKTYTIMDFCKEYDTKTTPHLKQVMFKQINIKQYVPYKVKIASAYSILSKICIDDNNEFNFDSPARYFGMLLSYVTLYTDLVSDNEDTTIEFDALKSRGLITEILNSIPEEEVKEYQAIFKMVYEDLLASYNSLDAIVQRNLNKLSILLNNSVENLSTLFEGVDMNKITDLNQVNTVLFNNTES